MNKDPESCTKVEDRTQIGTLADKCLKESTRIVIAFPIGELSKSLEAVGISNKNIKCIRNLKLFFNFENSHKYLKKVSFIYKSK